MASKASGNTGVRHELVSVCDELLRLKLIEKHNNNVAIIKMLITKYLIKRNTLLEELLSSVPSGPFLRECFRVMRQSN